MADDPQPRHRLLLGVLGFLTFSVVYNGFVMTPVLEQMAREFDITTGTAGLVVAAYGAPAIAISILAGPYSDRWGRKIFLVIGTGFMGVFSLLSAFAGTFPQLMLARIFAGMGSSVIFSNVNATIGDTFPYRERGRATSTVIAMNTMASIIGVPVAGVLADAFSWRVSVALTGVLALGATVVLILWLPQSRTQDDDRGVRALFHRVVTDRSAVGGLTSTFLGALFWFTWVTYLVAFFQRTFALSAGTASAVALTMGLGVLVGSQIGGRLGDRRGHRDVTAASIVIGGLLLAFQTNVPLPLVATAVLNFVMSAVVGARFATNQALMSEQAAEARGTVLAIQSSVVSVGIVAGATIGGILVDGLGFGALGIFCLVAALASAAVVLRFVDEGEVLETASAS